MMSRNGRFEIAVAILESPSLATLSNAGEAPALQFARL
jgi:hypothetical protein